MVVVSKVSACNEGNKVSYSLAVAVFAGVCSTHVVRVKSGKGAA